MEKRVAAVPKGFRTVTPCLTVPAVAPAVAFYEAAFNAVPMRQLHGVDGITPVHAELRIGNSLVLVAQEDPFWGPSAPASAGASPVQIHLYVHDVDMVWRRALAAGAYVVVPLENRYWGDRWGRLADPYGHVWSLASRIENVSAPEISARLQAVVLAQVQASSQREVLLAAVSDDEIAAQAAA
jgi:PhnB protein